MESGAEFSAPRDISTGRVAEERPDQCRILNPTPLNSITGYIVEDDVGGRYLERLSQIRLDLIDGCI